MEPFRYLGCVLVFVLLLERLGWWPERTCVTFKINTKWKTWKAHTYFVPSWSLLESKSNWPPFCFNNFYRTQLNFNKFQLFPNEHHKSAKPAWHHNIVILVFRVLLITDYDVSVPVMFCMAPWRKTKFCYILCQKCNEKRKVIDKFDSPRLWQDCAKSPSRKPS